MKTKKTILAASILAVIVAASLAFTSCGGNNADRASDPTVPKQETVIDKSADKDDSKDANASKDAKSKTDKKDNKAEKDDKSSSAKSKSDSGKSTDAKKKTDSSSGKSNSSVSGSNSSSAGNTSSGSKPSNSSGSSNASKPSSGSNGSSSGSKPSTGSGSSSNNNSKPSGDSGSSSQPVHHHTWETIYEDKYVDPVVETRPVYESHAVCNQCGMDFGTGEAANTAAAKHTLTTPGCQNYSVKRVQTGTEQVTIQEGYTTKVPAGEKCSTCGAVK